MYKLAHFHTLTLLCQRYAIRFPHVRCGEKVDDDGDLDFSSLLGGGGGEVGGGSFSGGLEGSGGGRTQQGSLNSP